MAIYLTNDFNSKAVACEDERNLAINICEQLSFILRNKEDCTLESACSYLSVFNSGDGSIKEVSIDIG